MSGGFNIFPRGVEDVISNHQSVAAVAVVGVPDETWGEAVKAVVVPRAGQIIDETELIELVKQRKGSHHAPKSIDIVDSIPVSAVGKPDKKALRARYWAGAEGLNIDQRRSGKNSHLDLRPRHAAAHAIAERPIDVPTQGEASQSDVDVEQ